MSEVHTLNTEGLLCPLPVIRTQDAIKQLQAGDCLVVTASDPGTQQDIPSWCKVHQHELAASWSEEDKFLFRIIVGGD